MRDSRWKDVNLCYTEPSQEYISGEMKKFEEIVTQFCDISQIDRNRIEVNYQTLQDVIIRVDMRKLYFRVFHSNMEANEYKVIMGLECFWILKLRPFWMKIEPNDSSEAMHIATWINEKIALHMACSVLETYNPEFFKEGRDICKSYCEELEYSFRYRDLSKESMFLMFDPFYFLYLCKTSVSDKGHDII